nr:sulfotransferase family 2 domain-containing protein [Salipiger sp. PrR003]
MCFFAHVPKCAGSSIEDYLEERFGPLAFLDRKYRQTPKRFRWTNSSPQHIPADAQVRLFPGDFFDASFAVVRHPYDRLMSAFRVQRDGLGRIPPDTSLSSWIMGLPKLLRTEPFAFDGHFRPMDDIVPPNCRIFRLEDGLNHLVDWLDRLSGDAQGPRHIGQSNSVAEILAEQNSGISSLKMTRPDRVRIARIYSADFDRFRYEPYGIAPRTE